jgi:flagellum-specific peptidoglycan hydrolase FlgJ
MENQTPENVPEDIPNPQEMDQQYQQNQAELKELKTQELPDDIKWITHEAVSESDQLELLRAYKSGDKEKFDEKYKDVRNSKLLDFAVELAPNLIPGGVIAKGAKLIAAPAIKLASKVAPSAVKAVSSLASNAAGAGKNALSALRSSANMVTGKISAGAKAVQGATSEAVSAGKELFKPAVEKVTKSIADAKSGFKAGKELSKAEDLAGAGISKMESLGIGAGQKLGRAKDFVSGTATKAIEKTKQMANNTKDVFSSGIKKAKDVGSNVLERAKTFGGKVTGAIKSAGGAAARVAGTAARVAGSVGRFAGNVARGIANAAMFLGGAGAGGTSGGTSRGGQGSLSAAGGGVPISAISGGDSGVAGTGSFGGEGAVGSKTALEALNKIHSTLMQMKSTNERMANDISLLVKQSAQKDVSGDLNSANLMARSNVAGGGGVSFGGYSGDEERGYSGGGNTQIETATPEISKPENEKLEEKGFWSKIGTAIKEGLGIVAPIGAMGLASLSGSERVNPEVGDTSEARAALGKILPNTSKQFEGSKKQYYDSVYQTLLDSAEKQGVKNPEAIARLGASQSSLETGYGKSIPGGNYFGIKAKQGQGGPAVSTQEFINGKMVTVKDKFRTYDTMQESADDYIKFLQENKRYKGVLNAETAEQAIAEQTKTGYATDPNYGRKLESIYLRGTAGSLSDKGNSQVTSNLLKVPEMPQTWVGENPFIQEPRLSSFAKNQGTSSEQIPNLETNQTQTHNLITQKYNISQTEKDKSATKVFAQSEINKPQLIGEVNQKEEPLGERPTDAFGAQMWDIRKAEIEGKTNQLEPLGEKPKDDLGGQLWETRKAEMEAKANPNKVEPLGERPVDEQSAQMWDIRKAEMEGGISENPIMDELGSYLPSATPMFDEIGSSLPSINEAPSVIPAVENEITSGLKGVTDIFSNVGTLITGAVGAIGGGDKKQSPMVVQAPAADSAGHGGNMMSVRNDDPLLLTLQYGNLRTV